MIKERSDCTFLFITKRIERFHVSLPDDWGDGYDNVVICCTCENQKRADERLPIFKKLPIKHKIIICEPLLENIDLSLYLDDTIEQVVTGGESGYGATICDYKWVINIQKQCIDKNVSFFFKQTGANFLKDGKLYKVERKMQHRQARKAGLNFNGKHSNNISNLR